MFDDRDRSYSTTELSFLIFSIHVVSFGAGTAFAQQKLERATIIGVSGGGEKKNRAPAVP